jgi:putative DeoR family transcriptional regulator (stage III sporulation protein D)
MKDYIAKRCLSEADFILNTGSTVRKTAKKFMISKSTVHKDMTERLMSINKQLALKVKKYWKKINPNAI